MTFFRNSFFFSIVFLFLLLPASKAQLTVDAGANKTICPGDSVQIGGTIAASGGLAPYTYSWSPALGLTSTTVAHPFAFPITTTTYTLTVTDDTGAVNTDAMTVSLKYITKVNAGNDITICRGGSTVLGGNLNVLGQGVSYLWSPNSTLSLDTIPLPTAAPIETTTYTLIATQAGCAPKTDYVTVTVIFVDVDAGLDTTINEGETIELQATGAFFYYWQQSPSLINTYTPTPDAEPIVTTTYYVWGENIDHHCGTLDSVTVHVIKGDNVYFFNTFTPNGDFINDTWYIGNILKYPENTLQIFNRNGQLVFREDGYKNTWDGKAFGQDLPAATYFYILDLGNEEGDSFHGTVTIIK